MSPSVSTSFLSKSRFFFKRISPRFVSGLACTLLTQLGGQPGCDNCNQGMMIIDHDHNHDHVGNHRLIVISVMRINLLALFLFHLLWHRGANLHGGDDDDDDAGGDDVGDDNCSFDEEVYDDDDGHFDDIDVALTCFSTCLGTSLHSSLSCSRGMFVHCSAST